MISKIRFINCQSFKDVTYDLATDKLNLIVADNDTGKSILFKVLKLAGCPKYYDRDDRKDLIRRGCQFANVIFWFTDSSLAVMRIYADKTIYGYLPTEDSEFEPSLEPPAEMIMHLGLLTDSDSRFIANIIDADQDLLLVNSNLAYNYNLIKMIVVNDDLDELAEKVDLLLKEYQGYLVRASDYQGYLEHQLGVIEFVDTDKLQEKNAIADCSFNVINKLIDVYDELDVIKSNVVDSFDFSGLLRIQELLAETEDALDKIKSVNLSNVTIGLGDVALLEKIENLSSTLILFKPEVREPISVEVADLLGKLEVVRATIHEMKVPKSYDERCETVLNVAQCVTEMGEIVADLISGLENGKEAEKSISKLQTMFAESGTAVDCPIYGKVVYDGKNCVVDYN